MLSRASEYVRRFAATLKKWDRLAEEKRIKQRVGIVSRVVWNLFLIFTVFCMMAVFFAIGAGPGYFASLVQDQKILSKEQLTESIYQYSESSEVYFADHVYLGKLPSDLTRVEVPLEEVSDYVIQALIATEDQYFYEHHGIVPKAIMRAVYQQLTNAPIETGGSTLTQQLVKNQILTPEVSYERKAKEMLYAMRIERFFTKKQILEAYLNVVPFGRNASGENIAGIQAAAQGVFGVDADELNLAQAAYLAGMPKNPFTYTPFKNEGGLKENIQAGLERMETVLSRMLAAGFITREQYEKALKYDIKKHLAQPEKQPLERYPYLTAEIKRRATHILAIQLANQAGLDGKKLAESARLIAKRNEFNGLYKNYSKKEIAQMEQEAQKFQQFINIAEQKLVTGGYEIHTTIDKKIYDVMQKVARTYENYDETKVITVKNEETGETRKIKYLHQVAAMLIENETGKIISFVAGRDYSKRNFNLATQAERQNGSTAKPLVTYAPAMELGIIQPGYIVADLPVYFEKYGWEVENYANNYHGLETARTALKESHNIPAAKIYVKMNPESGRATKFLKEMGVTSMGPEDRTNPSMAIGSWNKGITVEENTNAYVTFGNMGVFVDAYMIEKIINSDGEVVYQHEKVARRVFSPQTAYLMLDMMRDVLESGTAAGLPSLLQFSTDWAGKTGTSQNYKDSWFVATNPNVTLGVWTGYVKPFPQDHSGSFQYSDRTQQLWAQFANAAYRIRPKLMDPEKRFPMPSGIVRRTVCGLTGMLPTDLCREAGLVTSDLFNVKYVPTKTGDALKKGRYVIVNGKSYRALPQTPDPFVKEGILLKEEFFKTHFIDVTIEKLMTYMPENWDMIIPEETLKENGKTPAPVTGVRIAEGALHWNRHPESDIVGYYVYARTASGGFQRIASVPSYEDNVVPVSPGHIYYVTAVDIAGKQSAPSQKVGTLPEPQPKEPEKPKKPKEPKEPKKPKEPKTPTEPPELPVETQPDQPPEGEGDSSEAAGN